MIMKLWRPQEQWGTFLLLDLHSNYFLFAWFWGSFLKSGFHISIIHPSLAWSGLSPHINITLMYIISLWPGQKRSFSCKSVFSAIIKCKKKLLSNLPTQVCSGGLSWWASGDENCKRRDFTERGCGEEPAVMEGRCAYTVRVKLLKQINK